MRPFHPKRETVSVSPGEGIRHGLGGVNLKWVKVDAATGIISPAQIPGNRAIQNRKSLGEKSRPSEEQIRRRAHIIALHLAVEEMCVYRFTRTGNSLDNDG